MTIEYFNALQRFITKLESDQVHAYLARGGEATSQPRLHYETGRKYDKVVITQGASVTVRYFVDNRNGKIYGAKSVHAPNLRWYFGTIYNADKWDWSDFHGHPINDPSVRLVGSYSGYQHYMEV